MDDPVTVAVTGPTGDIGRALIQHLERTDGVERVVGMARRPFDPKREGLRKFEYVRGDITKPEDVERLVAGADIVVHLAFLIFGSPEDTQKVNLEGSTSVFRAAFDAGAKRLVYTSSVAAYGFHEDNPQPLTEDVPVRGSDTHYYSRQKAELEKVLSAMAEPWDTEVFVFRPCIVAGPRALSLIEQIPYVKLREKVPPRLKRMLGGMPLLRPVIPDPGVPLQLVHEDDVAQALAASIVGRGEPGTYNLAGDGEIHLRDLADALGWYSIPLPDLAVEAAAEIVSRLPYLPPAAAWLNAIRVPVLMDTTKAREKLGWEPRYDTLETLAETVHAAREQGLINARARPNA